MVVSVQAEGVGSGRSVFLWSFKAVDQHQPLHPQMPPVAQQVAVSIPVLSESRLVERLAALELPQFGEGVVEVDIAFMKRSHGAQKAWDERIPLPLKAEVWERIDAHLSDGETRLDLVRQAIERELRRPKRSAR